MNGPAPCSAAFPDARHHLLEQAEHAVPVQPPQGRCLPGVSRAPRRILPDRVQQPVARLRTDLLQRYQRLAHEPVQQVQDLPPLEAIARADDLRRRQGPAAREYREPA